MSLNDLSFSDRSGAVFSELYVCGLSGSNSLLFDGASRGLCSSRIDFVLPSKLNGLGLCFLIVFELGAVEGDSEDANGASDFEAPPTGLLVVDLSAVGSK
jgi:hypothetical protein